MALHVTKVNLPDRTRARLYIENDRQRQTKPHDIRGAIPLVDYTNPAKFPPYIFREYPKMPLLDHNKPIVIDETGNVLIFYEAADEVDFKQMNPEIADEIDRNTPAKAIADTIASQAEEIEGLRARLKAAGLVDEKPKNTLAAVTRREAAAPVVEATGEAPKPQGAVTESLRDTLPKKKPGANPLKRNN